MSGYGRLGKLQYRHQVTDAKFVFLQEKGHDAETGFVVKRFEDRGDIFHINLISDNADIIKKKMSVWRRCPFCADFIQQGAFGNPTKYASTFGVVHNSQKQAGLPET
jgi:hypothetical protein